VLFLKQGWFSQPGLLLFPAFGRTASLMAGLLTMLADDVARLRQVLDRQDGPTVVAGHSYGGQIMTALGSDAPNVAGLVYIAAFGLDEGESIGGLLAQGGPPTPRWRISTSTSGASPGYRRTTS
jgi:pimeloyl-ACP methyl ester carboxylesterase